jgi:hypothetical protein
MAGWVWAWRCNATTELGCIALEHARARHPQSSPRAPVTMSLWGLISGFPHWASHLDLPLCPSPLPPVGGVRASETKKQEGRLVTAGGASAAGFSCSRTRPLDGRPVQPYFFFFCAHSDAEIATLLLINTYSRPGWCQAGKAPACLPAL